MKVIKFLLFFVFLLISVGLISLIAGYFFWQPVSSQLGDQETQVIRFVVPKGQAITVIGNRLAEENLIRHPLVFRITTKFLGLESKILAGSYELSPSMSPREIAESLTKQSQDIWVTILEGWRMEEVAEEFAVAGLEKFSPADFLSQVKANNLEGKLYPDTYLIPREFTATQVIDLLTATFRQKIENGLAELIDNSDTNLEEIIIIASLIERESRGLEEMKQVAGVIYNRLEIGMPLQIDATLQYLKPYDRVNKTWWSPPLASDKQLDSPFNTYLNSGLPPQPIANPSLDAIRAALEPNQHQYFYYIHDRSGQIHLAKDLDEHNRNVNTYLR